MKPVKLKMEAFGSYGKETVIDFTKPSQNLFLITGDTGSGKSTIFDAIVFALYGQAGASDNAKGGLDLQSQYAGVSVTPYVELEFTEMCGGEEQLYRVRRQPQHIRNKRGGGTTDVKEQIEIFRPDESHDVSSVSQKQKEKNEINQEIVNIVGLTKEQFMQVAMIAQGDFTRLIKADTSERKPIFRKIFNTGIYEKIIDVLSEKNKSLSDNIKLIKTGMKTEVSRISIPEDYPERSAMEECKNRIVSDDKWSAADLEDELLPALKKLCEYLSGQYEAVKKKREDTAVQSKDALKKYTEAQELIKSFNHLEEAQNTLKECAKRKEEIAQKEKLERDIEKAYGISGVYDLLKKAEEKLEKSNDELERFKKELPELKKEEENAERKKELLKKELSKKNDDFARIDEAVNKALDIFGKIKEAEKEEKKCRENEKKAVKEKEEAEKAQSDFEDQLTKWEEERKQLSESGALLEKVKGELDKIKQAKDSLKKAETAENEINEQRNAVEQAQKKYIEAKKNFDTLNGEYLDLRKAFYDAQAGLLAKELEEGKPCPVCGSLSHPAPRKLTAEHKDLTQEYIDKKEQEVGKLDKKQQELSKESNRAKAKLEEKEKQVQEKYEQLAVSLRNAETEFTEPRDLKQIKKALDERQRDAEERKSALENNKARYDKLTELIDNSDKKRQELKERFDECSKKYSEAHENYTKAQTTLNELEKQKTYATEQDANEARSQAKNARNEAEKSYDSAEKAYKSANRQREQTETNIKTLEDKTIPEQQKDTEEWRKKYSEAMEKAAMTESGWQSIVKLHKKEEQAEIRKDISEYKDTVLRAEEKESNEKAHIEDKPKPDIEMLEKEKNRLDEAYREMDELYQDISKKNENNSRVYKDLTDKFSEQKEQWQKFNRVKYLRDKLAGKEAGEKTDIETKVQRIHLKRILDTANKRFREMSSDQFEFRMMDTSKSTGKDRGLELMVRSTITGKEQEVKMLSGGESFIAALSLALGISDQIQRNSASVNLDMMFIDEGFGSLDANTRNQAIKVLKNMAGDSKMIGIISHVSELQQQIDDKLAVERDRSGSSAHWIVS